MRRPDGWSGATALLSFLLLARLSAAANAGADTTILRSDTVWQGNVTLSGDVVVAPGATLLLLPGTVVRVEKVRNEAEHRGVVLDIRGRLLAQGRQDQPILFTSASDVPAPGDWGGIVFTKAKGGASRLGWCRIEHADAAVHGGVSEVVVEDSVLRRSRVGVAGFEEFRITLVGCEISENDKGLTFDADALSRVESCTIVGNAKGGIEARRGSAPTVRGCRIQNNGAVGVRCVSGSNARIEGNLIQGHERGIEVELMSNPEIVGNEIVDNGTGVWAEKQVAPLVRGNLITRNRVGVYCNLAARPRIEGNDILENPASAVVLGDNLSLSAERLLSGRSPGQQPRAGPLAGRLAPGAQGLSARTQEAVVDARGNWWGEAATAELRALGSDANSALFDDGRDKPTVEFVGPSGERTGQHHPRDRVAYAPWAERPVADAPRPGPSDAGARGRILFRGRPVAGARLYAFSEGDASARGDGLAFSAPTGADGAVSLRLFPGRYRLMARRTASPFPGVVPAVGDLVGASEKIFEVVQGPPVEVSITVTEQSGR